MPNMFTSYEAFLEKKQKKRKKKKKNKLCLSCDIKLLTKQLNSLLYTASPQPPPPLPSTLLDFPFPGHSTGDSSIKFAYMEQISLDELENPAIFETIARLLRII